MAFWKKIFKSKYTGAEIDAAVAKAGTVPAVSSADAGKALVVDEEGNIVVTTSYPLFTLSQAEISTIITGFITALVNATDKLTETIFTITDETTVNSIKSKIEAIKAYGFLTIEGFNGHVACYKGDTLSIETVPFKQRRSSSSINYNCMIHLAIYFKEVDNSISIVTCIQKINSAT